MDGCPNAACRYPQYNNYPDIYIKNPHVPCADSNLRRVSKWVISHLLHVLCNLEGECNPQINIDIPSNIGVGSNYEMPHHEQCRLIKI